MMVILNRTWRNEGFILLEVLISLAFLAVALVAVFKLQAQNLEIQSEAQFLTLAEQLARTRMSRIESSAALGEAGSSGEFGDDFPGFSYQEDVKMSPDEEHLFKVTVTITEDQPVPRTFSVETWLYRNKT